MTPHCYSACETKESSVLVSPPCFVCADTAAAGEPGEFSGDVPADLEELQASGIVPSPSDPWGAGQYVVLGDGTEVYWDGEAWVEGRAVPVITTSGEQNTGYYPIVGHGAKPGDTVNLIFHPETGDPQPHGSTVANGDGRFVFIGTDLAFSPATWSVETNGIESAEVTATWEQPFRFSLSADGLVASLTIQNRVHSGFTTVDIDWGDTQTSSGVVVHQGEPITHTYAAAGTYTVQVSNPDARYGWTNGSGQITVGA